MNDKMSRIALVLIALVASAFLVKQCVGDDEAETGGVPASNTADTGNASTGDDIDPNAGSDLVDGIPESGDGLGDAGLGNPAKVAPEPMDRREVGEPLEDGTLVELRIPYKAGTVTRYRIENATTQRNRDNDLTVFMRRWDDITTKVTHVAADGTARVRLTMDAVRLEASYPNGLIIEFDSRNPDDSVLDNPDTALVLKPMLALLGVPIELQLTTNGAPIEVEGLDGWTDAWEQAVERESPGASREIATPFARDTVMLEWRELLFPPIVGEPLKAGEQREIELLRDTMQKSYALFRGPMEVTHDDGEVFRVRMTATPTMLARQGEPRSPQEAAIAKVHIQASKDAYYAAWRFDRKTGRLVDAEIEARYQQWVSWPAGKNSSGSDAYQPFFLQKQRQTRVDLLSDTPDDE